MNLGPTAHGLSHGAGLSRGFGCSKIPWHLWNSLCEFDVLFVRRGLVGHWTQGVRITSSDVETRRALDRILW